MSTVSTLLTVVRKKIRDTTSIEYQDSELIDFLNDALDYMSSFMIRIKDGESIKVVSVAGNITKPDDFDSIVGSQLLYLENDSIKTLTGGTLMMRYYAMKPHVSTISDIVPFKASIEPLLAQLTAIYALNRNEFDVSQDQTLFEKQLSLLQGGGS